MALSKRLLSATYLLIETHDILLDVSSAGACPPLSSTMEVGGRDTAKVAYSRAVPATLVKDIARMVVLNRGIYERVNIASEQRTRWSTSEAMPGERGRTDVGRARRR